MASEALKPCGTRAAYVRHRRHGEIPCAACRAANTAYGLEHYHEVTKQVRRAAREFSRSRRAAIEQLIARHPAEFQGLYEQARRDAGRA